MNRIQALVLLVASLCAGAAQSCQFNTDCDVGSKCHKKSGQMEGICQGGLNPGNDNDRKPYRDSLDISKSVGNTCQFNTDCGVGAKCQKESGKLNGVCVK